MAPSLCPRGPYASGGAYHAPIPSHSSAPPGGPAGDGRTLLYIALHIATMRTVRNRGGRTIHMDLKDHIRHIPDFPKPGILFYDISTLLAHPEAWENCVDRLPEVAIGRASGREVG